MTDVLKLAAQDLARSGIAPKAAAAAGIGAVANAHELHHEYAPAPALVIPYIDPWTRAPMNGTANGPFARIRYLDNAPVRPGANPFKAQKEQRYAQPSGSGVHAYFPIVKNLPWDKVAADPEHPLLIVEGEKKALAATLQGFATIGLGGVFNFYDTGLFLPELEKIVWKGRQVYICFDSDAAHNPQIQAAEARFATELSMHRGAVLHLVRLPHRQNGKKQGVDDFLLNEGPDELDKLLSSAPRMRKIDAAVVSLNEYVAWIEKEGCVYDLRSKEFIQKSNFTNGSVYSALEVVAPTAKGTGVKRISVAESWLKHPHAQRYDYVEFRPEDSNPVHQTDAGGLALNMWTGWEPRLGDVSPFLELTSFLFRDLYEHAELPLKLLAYKAQNPGLKVPLALVLVGPQGCGKSLWAECAREAFNPYTAEIPSSALSMQFNGWTERTLLAVINEASAETLQRNAPTLRSLISDKRVMLNEKFRIARQIDSYTQYIITSNDRGAGAYSQDDRRMIVVSCPTKREPSFYQRVAEWKNSGGGAALLHYLLNLDLKGWTPPQQAPLTAEKYMSYMESLSPIQRLAEEMQTANEHVVIMWIQQALAWAQHAELSPNLQHARFAREIVDSLQSIQIRPWYTPEELALMFPAIVSQLHGSRTRTARPSGEISKELRTAGVTYLRSADDPRGFRWRGSIRQFLIVAEPEEWTHPLPQSEFERLMEQFPKYADLGKRR
ncbi:MAG: DUF3854 domain-containing protein [Pigmentiphaga sp.]|nr:DUF3854 domain-containing protein [Pigmentiphaga sp.]